MKEEEVALILYHALTVMSRTSNRRRDRGAKESRHVQKNRAMLTAAKSVLQNLGCKNAVCARPSHRSGFKTDVT